MKNKLQSFLVILGLIVSFSANAQEKARTGTVKDSQGLPLPGVNVLVKNTTVGTQTDFDGQFSVDAAAGDVLVLSYVGLETKEITVGTTLNFNVVLNEDSSQLDAVVVVGYGTQKKEDLTGAISSANLEPFRAMPNVSIAQSLQGTVPGLSVGQVNSAGENPGISIRGRNSLAGNNSVLVVVDGIVYTGGLVDLNPNDIESIDVLKDVSSTAIYGAQGANGVLLVTTKSGGKNRRPRITLSSTYTVQNPTNKARPLDREGYLEKVRGLYWNQAYLAPDYTQPNPDFDLIDYVDISLVDDRGNLLDSNFNWWDAATQPSSIAEYNVSISGGSENSKYLLSAAYLDQKGYIINDTYNRKNIRANLEIDVTDWLKVGTQAFATFNDYSGAEPTLSDIIRQPPLVEPFDENGELIPFPTGTIYSNPFMSSYVDNYSKNNTLFGNFYSEINFPFIDGLSYRVNFGNNYRWSQNFGSSEYGAGLTGTAYKNNGSRYDYTLDNILTYKKNIAQDHDITLTALYGASERSNQNTDAYGNGFTDLTLSYNALEQAEFQFINSSAWKEALNYQMGRLNYKFKDKYLVTGTLRREGFSGFAENKKWGVFPSLALAWVLTEETFFSPSFIDFLKLRGGYGSTGNLTSRYASLSRISRYQAYVFGDGGNTSFGQQLSSLANANLEWESTGGLNLGMDFRLFNGKISGSVEYYKTETENQLFSRSIPNISGVGSINVNLGNIQNEGVEFNITSQNITTADFNWSTTLNFSQNRNKILSLTGLDEDGDGKEDDIISNGLFIGRSIGVIYGYEAGDIYQLDDDIPEGYYPGTRRVIDQNGDGVINSDDRTFLGNSNSAFRAGLLNTFTYKGFGLNIFLNTIQGGNGRFVSSNEPNYGGRQDEKDNLFNYLDNNDFWTPLNPDGINERYVSAPEIIPRVLYDRSFIRLQDVSLSYTLPSNILEKLDIANLKLFVTGKNLATWTKWRGWDPETGDGLGDSGRPVLKSYSLGLNVTF